MKIKAWGSVLLLSCLCSAVTAQNGNRYLEKPLPRGWGNTVVPNSKTVPTSTGTVNSTTASADDNLFSGQILPVDDQWWKAFNDPVLDSLISVASGENYSVLAAIDRMEPLPDASEYIQFPTGIERRIIIMCDGLGQFGGVTTTLLAEPSTI